MNAPYESKTERTARLFKNGRSQAVRIPKEMEFEGKEVVMTKIGDELIIKPKKKSRLLEFLDEMAEKHPEGFDFPEIEDLPAEPVTCFDDWDAED